MSHACSHAIPPVLGLGRGIVSCLRTVRSVHASPTDWTFGVKHTRTWCGLPCVSSCRYRNVTVMSFSTRRTPEPAEPAAAQAASGTLPSEAHADGGRHPGRLRLGLHRLNRAVCARRDRKREACWSQVRRETGPPATCHLRGKTRRQSKRNLIFFSDRAGVFFFSDTRGWQVQRQSF